MRRRNLVVVCVTALAALVILCATLLIALDKIEGVAYAALIGTFLGPVIMILLSQQVGDVQEKLNGHMTTLISAASCKAGTPEPAGEYGGDPPAAQLTARARPETPIGG